jgi:hypothetical protein
MIGAMQESSNNMKDRHFVSVKEAARYMDVSYRFLWDRMGTPDGPPAQRIGKFWKIPRDEFIQWVRQPVIK